MNLTALADVQAARDRVGSLVRRTPVLGCASLGAMAGVRLGLKAELFQKTGSFKPRGILNKILRLSAAERAAGLVTVSAGNAAAAVAYGASVTGCPAVVCMPSGAVHAKVDAVRGYGGEVVLIEGDLLAGFERVRDERRLTVVHPFDDPDVVAGQGTVGLEIAEDASDADVVVVPVGGGGLISGVAAAIKATTGARIVGVEPETADIMRRSVEAGHAVHLQGQRSVADGLAPPFSCELTLAHVNAFVDELVTVSEEQILDATRLVIERAKLAAEPSGATAVAAVLAGLAGARRDAHVVCVVSGGNLDPSVLRR